MGAKETNQLVFLEAVQPGVPNPKTGRSHFFGGNPVLEQDRGCLAQIVETGPLLGTGPGGYPQPTVAGMDGDLRSFHEGSKIEPTVMQCASRGTGLPIQLNEPAGLPPGNAAEIFLRESFDGEGVPSSVELRRRPVVDQAALTSSS